MSSILSILSANGTVCTLNGVTVVEEVPDQTRTGPVVSSVLDRSKKPYP